MSGRRIGTNGGARLKPLLAAIVLAVLAAACAPAAPTTAPTPVPFELERIFQPTDIAAHAPAGWMTYETKLPIGIPYGGPTYIANQALPDPCTGSTIQDETCVSFPPPVALVSGGVIVGFEYQRQMLDVAFPEPSAAGQVITLNGFRTKIVRDMPGVCQPEGADETVTILIPSIGDWTGRTTVEACLRGPDLAANEAKLLVMIQAATAK